MALLLTLFEESKLCFAFARKFISIRKNRYELVLAIWKVTRDTVCGTEVLPLGHLSANRFGLLLFVPSTY